MIAQNCNVNICNDTSIHQVALPHMTADGSLTNLLSIRANPKSQSLITWCLVMRMFSGLTSLWMH